jgi:hypothetical protein
VAGTPNQSPAIPACKIGDNSCEGCGPFVAVDPKKDLASQPRKPLAPVAADPKKPTYPKKPADLKITTPPPAKPLVAKRTSPNPELSIRAIREGWFSKEECSILRKEAEDSTNFLYLMDTLDYVAQLLAAYATNEHGSGGIPWAVTGGLGLKLHGMRCFTADVDLVVQAHMDTIKTIFTNDRRFVVPGAFCPKGGPHLRVYFRYGEWARVARPMYVEVDLVVSGIYSKNIWF